MSELFEYKQAMDGLHFTEAQKKALAAQALRVAEQAAPRRRKPVWRTALIAAAVAAVLAVGAGASGVLRSAAEVLAPIFGGTVAQTEVIDKIGRPIGASDTDNGVTISADAIIGDKYTACIVYTISRDNDQPLLPEGVTIQQVSLARFGGAELRGGTGGHGGGWFTDTDPADNAIQYVQTFTADGPLKTGTVTAEFDDLCYYDDANTRIPVAEGHWKFRFDMSYEDASINLGNSETFTQSGMNFTITEVTVSPVAVQVAYEVDSEVVWSDAPSGRLPEEDRRQMERYMENVEILLTKTDGTVMDLSLSGGSIAPRDGKTYCTKGEVLNEIIPLEELASISVGGVVYPISAD